MIFPSGFEEKMKAVLGSEFGEFRTSYDRPRRRGLRVNTDKAAAEDFAGAVSFVQERIPWTDNGFYVREGTHPAQHPYYAAGLYYLQEPSAMRPAVCLPLCPGDKVLDLCAAPGGKATELAVRLALTEQKADRDLSDRTGPGVLIANEIHPLRAKALLRNLELTGMRDYCVLNESPVRLAGVFPGYFDKILVDAPCSGEGMFRKEDEAVTLWSQERVEACAAMQKEILEQAYLLLKDGGKMVYSTCTFSPEEDEEQVDGFLSAHPDMILLKQERLWPHKVEGEGHFLALLEKNGSERQDAAGTGHGDDPSRQKSESVPRRKDRKKRSGAFCPNREQMAILQDFLNDMHPSSGLAQLKREDVEIRQDRAYLPAAETKRLSGLHVIRNGLYLGEWKKNRFEPSQALALSLKKNDYAREWHLAADDSRLAAYLRGESIVQTGLPDGWTLVCADAWPVGWGKVVKGTVKNHYPAGWRK